MTKTIPIRCVFTFKTNPVFVNRKISTTVMYFSRKNENRCFNLTVFPEKLCKHAGGNLTVYEIGFRFHLVFASLFWPYILGYICSNFVHLTFKFKKLSFDETGDGT